MQQQVPYSSQYSSSSRVCSPPSQEADHQLPGFQPTTQLPFLQHGGPSAAAFGCNVTNSHASPHFSSSGARAPRDRQREIVAASHPDASFLSRGPAETPSGGALQRTPSDEAFRGGQGVDQQPYYAQQQRLMGGMQGPPAFPHNFGGGGRFSGIGPSHLSPLPSQQQRLVTHRSVGTAGGHAMAQGTSVGPPDVRPMYEDGCRQQQQITGQKPDPGVAAGISQPPNRMISRPVRDPGASGARGVPSGSGGQIQVEPKHVIQLLRQLVEENPERFKKYRVDSDMPAKALHQLLHELEKNRLIKQQEVLRRAHALAAQQQHSRQSTEEPGKTVFPESGSSASSSNSSFPGPPVRPASLPFSSGSTMPSNTQRNRGSAGYAPSGVFPPGATPLPGASSTAPLSPWPVDSGPACVGGSAIHAQEESSQHSDQVEGVRPRLPPQAAPFVSQEETGNKQTAATAFQSNYSAQGFREPPPPQQEASGVVTAHGGVRPPAVKASGSTNIPSPTGLDSALLDAVPEGSDSCARQQQQHTGASAAGVWGSGATGAAQGGGVGLPSKMSTSSALRLLATLPHDKQLRTEYVHWACRQLDLLVKLLRVPRGLAAVQQLGESGRLQPELLREAMHKYQQLQAQRGGDGSAGPSPFVNQLVSELSGEQVQPNAPLGASSAPVALVTEHTVATEIANRSVSSHKTDNDVSGGACQPRSPDMDSSSSSHHVDQTTVKSSAQNTLAINASQSTAGPGGSGGKTYKPNDHLISTEARTSTADLEQGGNAVSSPFQPTSSVTSDSAFRSTSPADRQPKRLRVDSQIHSNGGTAGDISRETAMDKSENPELRDGAPAGFSNGAKLHRAKDDAGTTTVADRTVPAQPPDVNSASTVTQVRGNKSEKRTESQPAAAGKGNASPDSVTAGEKRMSSSAEPSAEKPSILTGECRSAPSSSQVGAHNLESLGSKLDGNASSASIVPESAGREACAPVKTSAVGRNVVAGGTEVSKVSGSGAGKTNGVQGSQQPGPSFQRPRFVKMMQSLLNRQPGCTAEHPQQSASGAGENLEFVGGLDNFSLYQGGSVCSAALLAARGEGSISVRQGCWPTTSSQQLSARTMGASAAHSVASNRASDASAIVHGYRNATGHESGSPDADGRSVGSGASQVSRGTAEYPTPWVDRREGVSPHCRDPYAYRPPNTSHALSQNIPQFSTRTAHYLRTGGATRAAPGYSFLGCKARPGGTAGALPKWDSFPGSRKGDLGWGEFRHVPRRRLNRLDAHIQKLLETSIRRLSGVYGRRIRLADEKAIRETIKRALKDRIRAIAPSLYAVSEYRVDRLHQRLLQAASHEDCRAEAFQPADFGVFDGSSVGVGGEFQDALVGEGDLGSAAVLKLREDDCEYAGEIAGLGRSQSIGSQLLRKFEVKEDAAELHAFFMQKECDRHLLDHVRRLQENQRRNRGGRSRNRGASTGDSIATSAGNDTKEAGDPAESLFAFLSGPASSAACAADGTLGRANWLPRKAAPGGAMPSNKASSQSRAPLQLGLRVQQNVLAAEAKAVEFAKVAHSQRFLLLRVTALDFRAFLHTRTAAALFPTQFRLRQLQLIESLHFDLQTPPARVSRHLLVAPPPVPRPVPPSPSTLPVASSTSSFTCSSSAATKSAAGVSGGSTTGLSDPAASTTSSTKKSPVATHPSNAGAASGEQSLEEMFSRDSGTGHKQPIPRHAGQHVTAPPPTTQAQAASHETVPQHTSVTETAPVLGKKRPNKSPKPRPRKKPNAAGPLTASQHQTQASADAPKDPVSGGGAPQKNQRTVGSQLGIESATADHASADADALADLFGGQSARAPSDSPSGGTESLHRSREKSAGSPKQEEMQNRAGPAANTARKQGSNAGDQLPGSYGVGNASLLISRSGGAGSGSKQKKSDTCKQISEADTECRQRIVVPRPRSTPQGSWMHPGGFGSDGCAGLTGPGGGDVVIPDLDGEGEDEFI
ncbi:hypothetical protein CSUI_002245 [Cystoisospora suis]|uniref:Uncharacterized protein n=1 Tax=Cystoisospora suis TaxID=483139 RepID=A0A2C6KIN4_9APIC|nr:hypothetical protein CSUI_002245 [Cystoisospora suis]